MNQNGMGFGAYSSAMATTSTYNPDHSRISPPGFQKSFRSAADRSYSFVLDGELAIPSSKGFSFDLLVNRLRLRTNSERFRRELAETPAIYIVFDMLAGRESLLEQPFCKRRAALQRFFRTAKPPSPPIYLSASTGDLKTVETWITHIGQELDGIVAKRTDAPYRPGDDRAAVKIKNYRTIDCVIGGFRDRSIGSTHDELLLGLYDGAGRLHYVGSVDITAAEKTAIGKLTPRKTTPFAGRQPGDYSHWNTEPSGPWKPVSPQPGDRSSIRPF